MPHLLLRRLLPAASLAAFLPSVCLGGVQRLEEYGVELALPDSWTKDEKSSWGSLFNPPGKAFGIRIHLKSPENKTLWDILNETLRNFETKVNDPATGHPGHKVVAVAPFKAASGIEGLRITTGSFDKKKTIRPNVFHYVFFNERGKSVCICVYCSSGIQDEAAADGLVLSSMKLISDNAGND